VVSNFRSPIGPDVRRSSEGEKRVKRRRIGKSEEMGCGKERRVG